MKHTTTIILFTTPTCIWCKKIKQYLKHKGHTFKEVDVTRNNKTLRDMVRRSGKTGVPQVWINNRPVVGFDKRLIDKLLAEKKPK